MAKKEIGDNAFYKTGITSIIIPEGVTKIENNCMRFPLNFYIVVFKSNYRSILLSNDLRSSYYCGKSN